MSQTFVNGVWTISVPGVVTFRINCKKSTNLTQLNKVRKLCRKLAGQT